jgi:beta-lactamase superfamily II metal-dependent hydrolase
VHFIDVGQADCILIQTPEGRNILIDAGNNDDQQTILTYLNKQGTKKIDVVIGTHPHEDHIGSMDAVIKNYEIGKLFMPKVSTTTKTFEDVLAAAKAKKLKISSPTPGTVIEPDKNVKLTVLAPNSAQYDDLNNYSIVVKMTYGSTSFLFTGDAEGTSEKEILAKKFDIKADVLKIGHHGSDSSTTAAFLKAVSPKYAVISVGQGNDYGHPKKTTLDKLKAKNIDIYRTDLNGTIIATSDGKAIKFDKVNTAADAAPPKSSENKNAADIAIEKIDLAGEIVIIRNYGEADLELTGWKLVSVTGNQVFNFPDGFVLKTGKTVTIASGKASGDLKWSDKNIWNNEGDPGKLYDASGNLISSK